MVFGVEDGFFYGLLSGSIIAIVPVVLTYFLNRKYYKFNLSTDRRFELYNSIWASLMEVKERGDDLWSEANDDNLRRFVGKVKELHGTIEKTRILLDENDYQKIREIVLRFENYGHNKTAVISMNGSPEIPNNARQSVERLPHEDREEYEKLIKEILPKLRARIM